MTWTRQNNDWKKAYRELEKSYYDLQLERDRLRKDVDTLIEQLDYEGLDPKPITTIPTPSCCGQTTFVADTKGVIDRPLSYPEGTYIVTVTKKEG